MTRTAWVAAEMNQTHTSVRATAITADTIRANRISSHLGGVEPIRFWPGGFVGTPGAALPPRASWRDYDRFAVSRRVERLSELEATRISGAKRFRRDQQLSRLGFGVALAALPLVVLLVVLGRNPLGLVVVGFLGAFVGVGFYINSATTTDAESGLAQLSADLDEARTRNLQRLERELDTEINWEAE